MFVSPTSTQSRLSGGSMYRGQIDSAVDYRGKYGSSRISSRSPSTESRYTSSSTIPRRIGATSSSVRPLPVGPRSLSHGQDESTSATSSSSMRTIPIRYTDSSSSTVGTLGRRTGSSALNSAPGKPPLPSSAYERISATLGSKYLSSPSPDLRHSSMGANRYSRSSSSDRSPTFSLTPQRHLFSDDQHRRLPINTGSLIEKFERLSDQTPSRPGSALAGYRRPSLTNQEDYLTGGSALSSSLSNYANGISAMRSGPIYYGRAIHDDEERDILTSLMTSPSASGGIGQTNGAINSIVTQPGLYRSRASAISVPDVPTYASGYLETTSTDSSAKLVNNGYSSNNSRRSSLVNAAPLERQELEDDEVENGEEKESKEEAELRRKYSPANYRRVSEEKRVFGGTAANGSSNAFVKNEPKRSSTSSVESSESSRLSSGRNSDAGGNSRFGDSGRYIRDDDNNDYKKSGLVGLRNLGNTCFMNSVIQCLSDTRPLREYCLESSSSLSTDINNNTTSRMKGALMKAFRELLCELWAATRGGYVSPDRFKTQIQKFAPRFTGYSQQDAQEFLRYLLQGLHEDINRVQTRPPALAPIDDSLPDSQKALESWKRYLRVDDSKIVDMCVGQLKSELKCTHCGHVSTTFDPFWDLSLPIPQDGRRNQVTLYDCLDTFTKEEVLDGDEKPTCDECKTRRRCTKKFSIQKYPSILVLHMKRFSGERYRARLSTLVDFPVTKLDLSQYTAMKSAVTPAYDLYAVSNHSGTPLTGHYTAYCKNVQSGRWYLFDDTRVTPVNERSVVSSEAYVLFYELSGSGSCSRL